MQLEQANEAILHVSAEKKKFYRDVIRSVTREKLRLVDRGQIPDEGLVLWEAALGTLQDYPAMRPQVLGCAAQCGMGDRDARDFALAIGEAASNAIKHGGGGRCTLSRTPQRLIARIADGGAGIPSEDLPATLLQSGFSTTISLGMGYTLMLELADTVWVATEPDGTILQLEKCIYPEEPSAANLLSAWDRF